MQAQVQASLLEQAERVEQELLGSCGLLVGAWDGRLQLEQEQERLVVLLPYWPLVRHWDTPRLSATPFPS